MYMKQNICSHSKMWFQKLFIS